jgi:hypothetical protein
MQIGIDRIGALKSTKQSRAASIRVARAFPSSSYRVAWLRRRCVWTDTLTLKQ